MTDKTISPAQDDRRGADPMTTTPDPQLVREIARKHIRSGRTDIGTTIVKHFGDGKLDDEEFAAWEHEVAKAWYGELRAVSWPDEQPQDMCSCNEPRAVCELRTELDAANAECARATKRADLIDATLDAMRQQAIDAVKERNAANERAVKAEAEREKLRKEHRDAYLVVMEERDDARNAMRIERAERDEARARLARVIGAVHHAYIASELCEPEPGETMPTIASLWEAVEAIRDETADAAQDGHSATETDATRSEAQGPGSSSSTSTAGPSEPGPLHDEYGIRAEWISTLSSEGSVADTLGGALEALAEFDAKHGGRVVSRELVVRPVGDWRKLDDAEQLTEGGDRG